MVDVLPTDLRSATLERQVQVALACFSAGVSVSTNVSLGGFDTHKPDTSHIPRLKQIVEG